MQKLKFFITILSFLCLSSSSVSAQTYLERITKPQSARSDKLTGGTIAKTALISGDADIRITVNVPSFQLTLWQNGKEVKTYFVGVGMKDYPIVIGERVASELIWNPNWIPPDSDWVNGSKRVTAGEIILPTDSRNPLGKLKIPLGSGYLIHQARSADDLGSLVSHGCIRVLKNDLYDLAEKIAAARSLPITKEQIANAKLTSETLSAQLEPTVPVEITYDTHVIEAGKLHIYPDIYEYQTNTASKLRQELESSGVDVSQITDQDFERILSRAIGKNQFVVSVANIEAGRETSGGKLIPVVEQAKSQRISKNRKKNSASKLGVKD